MPFRLLKFQSLNPSSYKQKYSPKYSTKLKIILYNHIPIENKWGGIQSILFVVPVTTMPHLRRLSVNWWWNIFNTSYLPDIGTNKVKKESQIHVLHVYFCTRATAPWKVISNAFRLYPFDIFIRSGKASLLCLNHQWIWEMFSKDINATYVLDCECYQMHFSVPIFPLWLEVKLQYSWAL